jgi:hypothetical protein
MNRNDLLLSPKRLAIHARRVVLAINRGYTMTRALGSVVNRHGLNVKQGALVLAAVAQRLRKTHRLKLGIA